MRLRTGSPRPAPTFDARCSAVLRDLIRLPVPHRKGEGRANNGCPAMSGDAYSGDRDDVSGEVDQVFIAPLGSTEAEAVHGWIPLGTSDIRYVFDETSQIEAMTFGWQSATFDLNLTRRGARWSRRQLRRSGPDPLPLACLPASKRGRRRW